MRLSGSSSRSNPSGASNFPNDSESADACAGVQLMMRLSISIDVAGGPLSAASRCVVSWPNR